MIAEALLAKELCVLRSDEKGEGVVRNEGVVGIQKLDEPIVNAMGVGLGVTTPSLAKDAFVGSAWAFPPKHVETYEEGVGDALDG
jgi:hypothetical protein